MARKARRRLRISRPGVQILQGAPHKAWSHNGLRDSPLILQEAVSMFAITFAIKRCLGVRGVLLPR